MCTLFYGLLLYLVYLFYLFFFFKQKTAYEMRISDWSSDVCSSDLLPYAVWIGLHHEAQIPRTLPFRIEAVRASGEAFAAGRATACASAKIGRASCRERVCQYV